MSLKTKSMMAEPSEEDGLRICIMRDSRVYNRHLKKFQNNYGRPMYDMCLKALAPSIELKDSYNKKEISYRKYISLFRKEVLNKQKNLIQLLAYFATSFNITLLCSEKTFDRCHRKIIAEECKKYQRNLELILR